MENTRLYLELQNGTGWYWYLTNAEGDVLISSDKPYQVLTEVLNAIEEVRGVLYAAF
jgi:predicted secreted protein